VGEVDRRNGWRSSIERISKILSIGFVGGGLLRCNINPLLVTPLASIFNLHERARWWCDTDRILGIMAWRIWSIPRSSSQTIAGRTGSPCSPKRPKVSRWFEIATPAMRAGSTFAVSSRSARDVEHHQSSGSCSK